MGGKITIYGTDQNGNDIQETLDIPDQGTATTGQSFHSVKRWGYSYVDEKTGMIRIVWENTFWKRVRRFFRNIYCRLYWRIHRDGEGD